MHEELAREALGHVDALYRLARYLTRADADAEDLVQETYTHRFTTPGTYTYFCALHPHMTATVVVK